MQQKQLYDKYSEILRQELVPALGCTEPIAIAYASATAARVLGGIPEKIAVSCSGNIIKNVKSVIVPNTGGMKGIETAAVIGAVGGNPDNKLEVLRNITSDHIQTARKLLNEGICSASLSEGKSSLHIKVTSQLNGQTAIVEIMDKHTNIVRIQKNEQLLFSSESASAGNRQTEAIDYSCLTVRDIIDFANTVDLLRVSDILQQQIDCNTAISAEGLDHDYGANVGKTLLAAYGTDVKVRAKASAAAGSDARMSGCEMPVIINSGSGNQGMTVSLPVIEYAREMGVSKEQLYRALIVSNLVSIHQKHEIGRLSAYCGAVSAACGSGAGITYLLGGSYEEISHTVTNTLANVSGIICDGAKPSCAAKIASAVDAAIMAHYLTVGNRFFISGDGIVKDSLEETMQSVGRLGREGMKETDIEVLKIMLDK